MKEGYQAQLKSIVMLKNQGGTLPLKTRKTVYVPKRFVPASRNFLGMETPSSEDYPINMNLINKYFNVTDNPENADFALVYIEGPKPSTGYHKDDIAKGGNGYLPISLQYGDYTATDAREVSIAGGDPLENFTNRSYKGKTVKTENASDAKLVADTKSKMANKPVVVCLNLNNPMVFSEIEPIASAILIGFGVQDQALIETIVGKSEPSGLLPLQMPANMNTVEKQDEDRPYDMNCHKDTQGNIYDFGFGMNWKGVIKDNRKGIFK
jgi:beta-glucosidase